MKFLIILLGTLVALAGSAAELPKNLKWKTNDKDSVFASPEAKKGGTLNLAFTTFPLTLRTVGPDANTILYHPLIYNQLSLTTLHPNTLDPIPVIATHWAFGDDGKTVYYKLNKKAQWSDGKPVKADDFVFTLEFMKSKNIVAPWYNNYYSSTFESVVKYDDHTISITLKNKKPKLVYFTDLPPTPKHFYEGKVPKDFVTRYNWKVVPNTGPYQISKLRKGRSVIFKRKKSWWAKDLKYFKNRFNVDYVKYTVIREDAKQFEAFKRGDLDLYGLTDATYWHEKTNAEPFKKGYIERIWFYNDTPRPTYGLWLNRKKPLLKDINVREAIAHSINFEKVIKTLLRNEVERLPGVSRGFGPYTNQKIKPRAFDLKKADEAFAKAGWTKRGSDQIRVKGSERMSIDIMYSADIWEKRLVVVKEEAKKAGLEINLRKLDWSAVVKAVDEFKHDLVLMGFGSSGIFPHYWDAWHSDTEGNLTANYDKEMDKMIEAYRNATREAEKIKLSLELQKMIHDTAAFIPAFMTTYVRLGHWRYWRLPKQRGTKSSKSLFSWYDTQYGGRFWFDKKMYEQTKKYQKSGKAFKPVTIIDETYRVK